METAAMLLCDARVPRLGEDGYFVVDGLLGETAAAGARREALALVEAGLLRPSGLSRGAHYRRTRADRGDDLLWLDPDPARPALTRLLAAFDELREALNGTAYLGLRRQEVQLAHYPAGGARYVRHLDAFPGGPNRVLTAIYYLNEGWRPEDGGALRLFPDGRPEVLVEPLLDRLAVFLSARLEHEVLPAWSGRLAATAWFYGA